MVIPIPLAWAWVVPIRQKQGLIPKKTEISNSCEDAGLARGLLIDLSSSRGATHHTQGEIMKTLNFIITVLSIIQGEALASTAGQATITAQQPVQIIQLTDQKYEPIYGEEPYQSTCSREVFDHTETVCHTEYDNVCHGGGEVCTTHDDSVCNSSGCTTVPRRECHTNPQVCTNVPRRECNDHAVYRTDYYSCVKYRTVVVGQRLVKTFNHQIEVAMQDAQVLGGASLAVAISVSEESVNASLMNSFSAGILNYRVDRIQAADAGSIENLVTRITIEKGLSAEQVSEIRAISIDQLELGHSALRFKINRAVELAQNLKIAVKLVRNPKLWASTTLYDGSVKTSALGLVSQGSQIQALIPFQKLGIESINDARHDLQVSVSIDAGKILNRSDFSGDLSRHLDLSLMKTHASF